MGNVLQINCDGAFFNRCLDCFLGKAAYIHNLQDNVDALKAELGRLIATKNDLMTRVVIAELQQMKRLSTVQEWLSSVQAIKPEADELIRVGPQQIDQLYLGGYCSRNCRSSYKFGKQIAKKLRDVKTLISEGVFEEVAERVPVSVADERPTQPTVVGLQSTLEQVWRYLVEEPAGIVGLYGMGGVGKTTLLDLINNKFVGCPNDFDYVIWVVASKDLRLEKIQATIGQKIGLFNDSWKSKSLEDKALDIFKSLRQKKFVLLLDDIWERVDLKEVGIPLPSPQDTINSKVVFTTRFINVCGSMEAHRNFKVECLSDQQAWELFQIKVGAETLNSHPDILDLAQLVAKECAGLPLALITIGRAMAYKKTPQEWRYAIEVLRKAASEFQEQLLGKEVYPLLKFSYDSLPNDPIRSCFLYCCLYPEDYSIYKRDLIDCWICEGFLDGSVRLGMQNQGYNIVGTLVRASLLEEVGIDKVKMHDVIRDMALWIACEIEKKEENFLVSAGVGLTEAPDVREWENVRRLSLMQNSIENLSEVPTCHHLHTLFLDDNKYLKMITNGFFQFMPSLKVLKMSDNRSLWKLPLGISKLDSLQLLDLSNTNIEELSEEFKALINLICLNLEWASYLIKIPRGLVSNSSRLRVLRMFGTGFMRPASENSVFGSGGKLLVEELVRLKYLEVLEITLRSWHALESLLSSHKLTSCTQALFLCGFEDSKSIYAADLADLENLNRLHIFRCQVLEELKIDFTGVVQKTRQVYVFHSLHEVNISRCQKLKDLTFLAFAPNIKSFSVSYCSAMEEIISVGKFADIPEMMGNNISPFTRLQHLELDCLQNLESIYWKPLTFPHLKDMRIHRCFGLRKLPLDSNSAKEHKIVIRGKEEWWKELQWEDEATQSSFLPCFQSL